MDGVKSTISLSTVGIICLVCTSRPTIPRFVASAFGVVAERATLLCNKLWNKSVVSSALDYDEQ